MTRSRLFNLNFASCFLLLIFLSCSKPNNAVFGPPGVLTIPYTPPLPAQSFFDISYGSDPFQKMDLYLPKDRNVDHTPMLIMVHGGQWFAGDKSEMEGYHIWLKDQLPEWAFANINYRLVESNANKFPAQEQDVEKAVNFIIAMADSFRISKKKIAVLGESAGGQLALLVANKMGKQKIKVAVGISVPSNVEDWYENATNPIVRPLLELVTGGTPDQLPLVYQNANVFRFISINSPKTFLVHGKIDGVVSYNQSVALADKINSSGPEASLLLIENETHNFTAAGQTAAYNGIISFLKDPNLFR